MSASTTNYACVRYPISTNTTLSNITLLAPVSTMISLAANSFCILLYRKRWPKHLYIRWRLVIDSPKTITSMAKTSSPCLLVATHSYLPPSFLLRIWSNRESFASGVSCLFSFRHTILKGMSPSGAQLRWTASPVTSVKFVYSWSMTTERGTKEKFKCVGYHDIALKNTVFGLPFCLPVSQMLTTYCRLFTGKFLSAMQATISPNINAIMVLGLLSIKMMSWLHDDITETDSQFGLKTLITQLTVGWQA